MQDDGIGAAMRLLHESLLGAWNRRDAAGMARLYAARGTQIGFDGSTVSGPEAIEAHLAPIFASRKTPCFVALVREVRAVGDGAALLRAEAGMVPEGGGDLIAEANAVQTLLAARGADGTWRIELFQNTPAAFHGRPEARRKLTEELRAAASRAAATL